MSRVERIVETGAITKTQIYYVSDKKTASEGCGTSREGCGTSREASVEDYRVRYEQKKTEEFPDEEERNRVSEKIRERENEKLIRRKIRQLTDKLNANFTADDFFCTMRYQNVDGIDGKQAHKDAANFIRRLKYHLGENSPRFIFVISDKDPRTGDEKAIHIHMVIKNEGFLFFHIDGRAQLCFTKPSGKNIALEQIWGKGSFYAEHLRAAWEDDAVVLNEEQRKELKKKSAAADLRKLGKYMVVQSLHITGTKIWICSHNLKSPVIRTVKDYADAMDNKRRLHDTAVILTSEEYGYPVYKEKRYLMIFD